MNKEDLLTPEQEKELAGFDEKEIIEIDRKYQLQLSNDEAEKKPLTELGITKLFAIFLIMMATGGLAYGTYNAIKPKPITQTKINNIQPSTEPKPEPTIDYKTKYALAQQENSKIIEPPTATLEPLPKVEATPPPPEPTPSPIKQPPRPVARVVPQPQPKPVTKPKPQPNPEAQWQALANFGRRSSGLEIPQTKLVANNLSPKPSNKITSAGLTGIINRQKPAPKPQPTLIASGRYKGEVNLGLVWDGNVNKQQLNRFALTVKENILDTEENVLIPEGAIAIAEVEQVAGNGLVTSSVIAFSYTNSQGKVIQKTVPPNQIIIRAKNSQPLIAKPSNSRDLDDKLLWSGLNTLGTIGKTFLEPDTTSTTVINGIGRSSSNTTQTRNKELWAAVLDGFFTPLAQEAVNNPNRNLSAVFTLPEGKNLSLIILQPIKVF